MSILQRLSTAWYKRPTFINVMGSFTSTSSSSSSSRNRLGLEKSPYLLQHANNPVDWYPWGPEAFQKAKVDDKPIFLSIGYSTCHWCHVMESESFESPEIGQLLNERYVSIKVDREERPDVDKVYMTFVQATTGAGGWPLNVWLTPDLKPIFGGTYFPPDGRYFNKPGFKTILDAIAKQWIDKRSTIETRGTQILDALMRGVHASDSDTPALPSSDCIKQCYHMLENSFDEAEGGFGKAPKFPQPVNFSMLLRIFKSNPDNEIGARSLHMCLFTLKKISDGGIHDHVSQGFHRYSTDDFWHVPHFEKMLYDQAQLAVSYIEAFQVTRDPLYAEVAWDIFQYVNRDLSHPKGGFYSAEDADSFQTASSKEKREGAFCAWQFEELESLLSKPLPKHPLVCAADVFCHHFGAREGGNVNPLQDPHDEFKDQNVLKVSSSFEVTAALFELSVPEVVESLDQSLCTLYKARQKRPRPHLDDKMVAAWNGLMLSAYSKGSQVLQDSHLLERAIQAASFLRDNMFDGSTLFRSCYTSASKGVTQISPPIHGFLDDYAFVIRGLLDLYESCHHGSWLSLAEQLQETQNRLFWDKEDGGFYSSKDGDPSIVLRLKDDQDGAEPSPNSVSASNLLRLSAMLGRQDHLEMAERIFRVFTKQMEKIPQAVPELISAFSFHQSTPKQIIIVGDRDSDDTKALLATVHKHFLPNKVLIVTDGNPESFICSRVDSVKALEKLEGKATAFVCENFTCKLPVNSTKELDKILDKS